MNKKVLFSLVASIFVCWSITGFGASNFRFKLLHTNDLHSYFEGDGPDMSFTPKENDGDLVKGNYARLAYLIKKEKRESKKPTLLVDAGDFFAGTLFHALGPNKRINYFPEAEFFSLLGFDATTFGNHEFDARDIGLTTMLEKWKTKNIETAIVSTNALLNNEKSSLKEYWWGKGPIKEFLIKELVDGDKKLRVGIIGLLGPDGALVSLGTRKDVSFIGFEDSKSKKELSKLTDHLAKRVGKLKRDHKLDLVIALLHGGHPEDEDILKAVPDINILVAGHTHQIYPNPIRVGNSLLVQAGSFGRYLGKLELEWDGVKLNLINKDTILKVDDSVPADKEMLSKIELYKKELDSFLKPYDLAYNTFIHTPTKSYIRKKESLNELGVLITSGIRNEINKGTIDPVDFYFTSLGLIRKNMLANQSLQLSDIFKILAIGFDENLKPGGKVVSFYLTKEEVFDLINFLEVYGMISAKFTPAFSDSITYHNRWWGIPFINKLGSLKLNGKEYNEWPQLIHVSTSQFVAAYLPKVQAMSYGMLEFIPKDKNGKKLNKPKILEDKEYLLFAKYLRSLNNY